MTAKYILATVSFAILCSLIWLMMGGSILQAVGLYLISGQVAMVTLICMALVTTRTVEARAPRR